MAYSLLYESMAIDSYKTTSEGRWVKGENRAGQTG
jgi:hypothetical protein